MNEESKDAGLSSLLVYFEYHDIERPDIEKLAGHIIDIESSKKINGAMIRERSNYITDTYASLFYQYRQSRKTSTMAFFGSRNYLIRIMR